MTKTILSLIDFQEIFNYSISKGMIEIKSQVGVQSLDKLTQVEIEIIGVDKDIDIESFSWFVKRMMSELEGFIRITTDKTCTKFLYHPLFCYDQANDYDGYKAVAQNTNSILVDIFCNG